MQPAGFEPAPAYTFAAAGFAVSDPDYLGLGTGPGLQPYLDLPSETTAALDMLRAVRHYLIAHGDLVRLNPDPQLGAKYSVLYAAFGLVALNRVHHVYSSPAQVFKPPYASTIETLLDGNHTSQQLIAGTPDQLSDLLTARGFAMLRHPAGAFAAALDADSSACAWAPRVPTRLYLATDDEQVVNANTWHCQAAFAAHGARATAVNLGTPDHAGSRHFGSNVAGTAAIVRWFSRLAA